MFGSVPDKGLGSDRGSPGIGGLQTEEGRPKGMFGASGWDRAEENHGMSPGIYTVRTIRWAVGKITYQGKIRTSTGTRARFQRGTMTPALSGDQCSPPAPVALSRLFANDFGQASGGFRRVTRALCANTAAAPPRRNGPCPAEADPTDVRTIREPKCEP